MSLPFYMDVHVPKAITVRLKLKGIDVLTAQDDGRSLLDDASLLKRATELNRILFSQDSDFIVEAAKWQRNDWFFKGIVYGHQMRGSISQYVEDLWLIAEVLNAKDLHNQLIYLPLRIDKK